MSEIFLCLLLLLIANGAPVIAHNLFGQAYAQAIDGGRRFIDGKPLLGRSKTIRGVLAAVLCTALAAWILQQGLLFGALFAAYAMLGDLFSSFIKRRLAIAPSGMALGLDQIPEVLFPLLAFRQQLTLDWYDVWIIVCVFFVLELVLSGILYRLKLRKRPY